ncbi:NUDIX domain-containing protein [Arthrobacter sp. MSA 4-2]|uniref:NUDIX hydrolase n=1 Tax=Arthrobacter sp. MSA 4-2 TaxID=2794349 RepID=UPI0018E71522|nr:NUDIX domain-containing protein [Arthrobacter sp. MSA 4-2]MBJ2122240.1 NUDIX domain-containing protein [Arthrobacter sp. MSA 4-2]
MTHVLSIAALCLLDDAGRLLLVRKRGTTMFMQPGGKLEPGESAAAAAVRELQEELGLTLPAARLRPLGRWYGPAANEPDTFIDAAVFLCPLEGTPVPAAEIEEIGWLDLAAAGSRTDLAPLLTEFVLPALGARPPPEVTARRAPR